MAESGRRQRRDPKGVPLRLDFKAGQSWNAGENSSNFTILGSSYPNIDGGIEMCKGYESIGTDDWDGGLGAGTGTDNSFDQDGKRNYMFDLHNEQIAIFRPGESRVNIWKKTNTTTYQAYTYNMKGRYNGDNADGFIYDINTHARDPLQWANKVQTTQIGGWIVHGNPSKDPYYQTADKVRSAFCVWLDNIKGQSEEYYDPGRILPMVEAGFYTDSTNPKISFHGVPVPIVTGQHEELAFGAPLGDGQIVDGDKDHFSKDTTAVYGEAVSASVGSLSGSTPSPTQRMFIAMENTLDDTAPNCHMFIAPHANDEANPLAADTDQKLWWSIKSQEGGVDQEYSIGDHYVASDDSDNNIDDLKDGSSATATAAGHKINWSVPHPVSVDFDIWGKRGYGKGDMWIAYYIVNGSQTDLILKKYNKGAYGKYTEATADVISSRATSDAYSCGVKIIHSPPDDQHPYGCLYVVENVGTSTGTLVVYQITLTSAVNGGWSTSAVIAPKSANGQMAMTIATNDRIGWFSVDILPKAKDDKNNVLVITAQSMENEANPYIWHGDTASLHSANDGGGAVTTVSMSQITENNGWQYPHERGYPMLMRCFQHERKNMVGLMGMVVEDSKTRLYSWVGEYNSSLFDASQTTFTPSSGEGTLYENFEDEDQHNFEGKIAQSNNNDSGSTNNEYIYRYHGDLQGRFHYKAGNFNRWVIKKQDGNSDTDDLENYVGRISFNYLTKGWDVWNPYFGDDDEKVNKEDSSKQAGCRPGALGDSNGLIPTKLGLFFGSTSNGWNDYDHGGITGSKNGATCMFPTTWNGNVSLMYPAYYKDHPNNVHGATTPKKLDMVIHGTIYGGSRDGGHPYLRDVTEGSGDSTMEATRPYPSNNLWSGTNMNPLTPIVKLPDGEREEDWHPKTDTMKKPILAGLDINMINRITTTSGDIAPGKYRYKIAFAKSGSNEKYKNTGAEGNIFNHNKLDAFVEVDTTDANGRRGIKLHFNKELLGGRELFSIQGDPAGSSALQYAKARTSMAGWAGTATNPGRLMGNWTDVLTTGYYTHLDHYSGADIVTNPYLDLDSTALESLKYYYAAEDDQNGGEDVKTLGVYVSYVGNHNTTASSNLGLTRNIGTVPVNFYGLHLTDSSGTNLDLSSTASDATGHWIKQSTQTHLSRLAKYTQYDATAADAYEYTGGGLVHYGPGQDPKKPYIRYILIYRTGDISKASVDKEAYFKVGELDLAEVDWTDTQTSWDEEVKHLTFLDTIDTRHMSSEQGHYLHGMMPVDGDNITAMSASGNKLWVAFNDTSTSTANKDLLPSTLMYTTEHWEYMTPLNSVVVDDNAVIHDLKDFNGSLWIFTDIGTYVIPDSHSNPLEANFRVMLKSDFVIHRHPNDSERFVRVSGKIFVLGEDGLYVHDPNPMSPNPFQKVSTPVDDWFKFNKDNGAGLFYNKDEESIICYAKKKNTDYRERVVTQATWGSNETSGQLTVPIRIHTVNFHVPTKSWWSYMASNTRNGSYVPQDACWEQIDDVLTIASNPSNTAADSYKTRASSKYSNDSIMIAIRDAATASSKKRAEMVRLGHVYGPFVQRFSDATNYISHDIHLQTSWIGDAGTERYWDKLDLDWSPAVYQSPNTSSYNGDTSSGETDVEVSYKVIINIDAIDPYSKDTAHDTKRMNENISINNISYYQDENVRENVSQGFPKRMIIPIKVKSELIRLRISLRPYASNSDKGVGTNLGTDCTPPKILGMSFRTNVIGMDRTADPGN